LGEKTPKSPKGDFGESAKKSENKKQILKNKIKTSENLKVPLKGDLGGLLLCNKLSSYSF